MTNYELNDKDLNNVPGGVATETYAVGEWVETSEIPHMFARATDVAYQVLAVDGYDLTIQEYRHNVGQSGYRMGLTYHINAKKCWRSSKPNWF